MAGGGGRARRGSSHNRVPEQGPSMRLLKAGAGSIPIVLAILAGLCLGAGRLAAADPDKKDTPPEKKDDAPPEKRYAFQMDGKPWDAVFKWLTEETGKEVV